MMKIHIYRGQNQIGGSIIEIATESTRVVLDVGTNLNDNEDDTISIVDGLFEGKKNYDAVLISHYHSDHMGLLANIREGIPIYIGETAYKIYEATAKYQEKSVCFNPAFLYDKQKIRIGDITVTPFLCDHSAYDSYMFLVEANGKSILYTGDFRANGRMDFIKLLERLPEVDAIIIEGTTLTREIEKENIEEEKLEKIATDFLKMRRGPAFIMTSAMNVERVVTAYNVAQKTDRMFLEDIYTADVMMAAGDIAPRPNLDKGVRVFTTGGQKQYERLLEYGQAKIGKYQISKTPFLMCIRQSMKNYLQKLSELVSFEDGVLFYGMWKGYMEQPKMHEFLEFMKEKGVKLHVLHTSGHADAMSIDKLIQSVKPKWIIPVHTENPEWFQRYTDLCKVVKECEIEL